MRNFLKVFLMKQTDLCIKNKAGRNIPVTVYTNDHKYR